MTRPASWLALAICGLTASCAQPPAATRPVYSVDFQGAAQTCTVSKNLTLSPNKATDATMTVGNDGGWCAISVSQPGAQPYDAGLLATRPAHGKVLIHPVGDNTRIDYTPDRGYKGADSFTVALLPGSASVRVTVTVQ